MKRRLTRAEVNHLRRLLGWANCEVGPEPATYIETVRKIAPAIAGDVSPQGLARIEEGYRQSANVPQYIRAAIKALRKAIADDYEIVDSADNSRQSPLVERGQVIEKMAPRDGIEPPTQ